MDTKRAVCAFLSGERWLPRGREGHSPPGGNERQGQRTGDLRPGRGLSEDQITVNCSIRDKTAYFVLAICALHTHYVHVCICLHSSELWLCFFCLKTVLREQGMR